MKKLNIEKLEALRQNFGDTYREFADRIGMSHTAYYNLVNNDSSPNIRTINKIAEKLKVDFEDLMV